uniref:Secreted protein n=1 Tax=Oryza brachyantha TaxID=4533 RepID=J3MTD8_ORYBR
MGPLPSISVFRLVLAALSLTDDNAQVGLPASVHGDRRCRGALPEASATTTVVEDFPHWLAMAPT